MDEWTELFFLAQKLPSISPTQCYIKEILVSLIIIITITSPPQSHLGRVHHFPSWQKMHSCAACASCAMSTADKSSYSAMGTLHPYHDTNISPLTHRSLTVTFTLTLTLLTILISLQPPASINPQISHSNNVKVTIACNSA